MATAFTLGSVLQLVFNHIQASPSVLAEYYVDRDRTLVYKWLRDTAFPSKNLMPDIIRFAMERSSESARAMIQKEINLLIERSDLNVAQKEVLWGQADFRDYLEGVFNLLAAIKKQDKTAAANTQHVYPKKSGNLTGTPTAANYAHANSTVAIRPHAGWMKAILFALLAAACGEALWGAVTWALGWPYDPGGAGDGGFTAFVWGLFFTLPVALFAFLYRCAASTPPQSVLRQSGDPARNLLAAAGYSAAGGIAGLLLTNSRLAGVTAGLLSVSAAHEVLILFISAFVLSFLPLFLLMAVLAFPEKTPRAFLLMEFIPALICVAAALPVLLSHGPESGGMWPGGFLAGFVLKFFMFLCLQRVLERRSNCEAV